MNVSRILILVLALSLAACGEEIGFSTANMEAAPEVAAEPELQADPEVEEEDAQEVVAAPPAAPAPAPVKLPKPPHQLSKPSCH